MYTYHVLTKKTSSWLVVSTPLKNISQIGSSSQIYIMYKKTNIFLVGGFNPSETYPNYWEK
jgi:hypothetical protein